jgi:hypothetical protein
MTFSARTPSCSSRGAAVWPREGDTAARPAGVDHWVCDGDAEVIGSSLAAGDEALIPITHQQSVGRDEVTGPGAGCRCRGQPAPVPAEYYVCAGQ